MQLALATVTKAVFLELPQVHRVILDEKTSLVKLLHSS